MSSEEYPALRFNNRICGSSPFFSSLPPQEASEAVSSTRPRAMPGRIETVCIFMYFSIVWIGVFARASERRAHRKLEFLDLIAEQPARLVLVLQWHRVRKAEQAHGRQPLDGCARRGAHLAEIELVVGTVTAQVAELRVTQVVRLAGVEEQADARGCPEFLRHRHDEIELRREARIAAVGISERIARAQRTVAEATHRIGATGENVPVRWCRGGIPQRRGPADIGGDLDGKPVEEIPPRNPEELLRAEIHRGVFHGAARRRHAETQPMQATAGREQ